MAGIPRLSFEDLSAELKQELEPKVRRLGYLGEFFQVGAHQPEALLHFVRFTEALKGALPINLVELLALTISTWSENTYEKVQHERLALKSGLSEAWVRDVERLSPSSAISLSATEKAAQALALAMATTHGRGAQKEVDAFLEMSDPATLVAALLTVGRYLAHSAISNTVKLTAPVASPLGVRA